MASPKSCPSNKMLLVSKASQKAWTTPHFLFHHLLVKHFFKITCISACYFMWQSTERFNGGEHTNAPTQMLLVVASSWTLKMDTTVYTAEPANPIMMALVSVTGSTVTRDNFETISDCTHVLIHQDKTHSKNACIWCPGVGGSRAIGPEQASICPWLSLVNLTSAHPRQDSWLGPHGPHLEQTWVVVSF